MPLECALRELTEKCRLTPAETVVVGRAVKGLSNKEIAAAIGSSVHTVRAQLLNAYRKVGVNGRSEMSHRVLRLVADRAGPRPEPTKRACRADMLATLARVQRTREETCRLIARSHELRDSIATMRGDVQACLAATQAQMRVLRASVGPFAERS